VYLGTPAQILQVQVPPLSIFVGAFCLTHGPTTDLCDKINKHKRSRTPTRQKEKCESKSYETQPASHTAVYNGILVPSTTRMD
jgi:hypothetical protein